MPNAKVTTPTSMARLTAAAFAKYAPALHRYVLRRLRRPQDAPDLTQTIFERFLAIEDAELIRNPQAYLFGIASNVIGEFRMREEQSLVTFDSQVLDAAGGVADQATPDQLGDRLGLERELEQALSSLPDSHRAVLLMVKRDGMSYVEAARVTGLTVNTVGTYVKEARTKMKLMLGSDKSAGDKPK